MAIKKKQKVVYVAITIAIVLGIVLGGLAAWHLSTPRGEAIDCLKSGGIVVIQERGAVNCVQKNLR